MFINLFWYLKSSTYKIWSSLVVGGKVLYQPKW